RSLTRRTAAAGGRMAPRINGSSAVAANCRCWWADGAQDHRQFGGAALPELVDVGVGAGDGGDEGGEEGQLAEAGVGEGLLVAGEDVPAVAGVLVEEVEVDLAAVLAGRDRLL